MTSTVARPFRAGGTAVAVWIVALVAALFLLRSAATLLIPIVLAVLISYALEPAVAWLAARRVPRAAGTAILLGAIVGGAAAGAFSLRDDAAEAMQALPRAAERARALWSEGGTGPARHVQRAADVLRGSEGDGPVTDSGGGQLTGWVAWGVGSALSLAGHLTVIVFLAFFLLLAGGHFKRRLVDVAGRDTEDRRLMAAILDDIDAQIQRFLLVRATTAAAVAVATWAVLAWSGVGQAAVWGILAGVFNSIPYFGPVIVSGGLFVVDLIQSGNTTHALTIAGAALVITAVEGWLLTPPLMGKAERMHVVVVFLGVLLWTWLWGAWGTILAVPMLAIVKSVADHVDGLKPLGRLMAP